MMPSRLLSGNEAVALGAQESGVRYAVAYPGTPSTEILESIAIYADINAHWATNEKVAMEEALGAAIGGMRSLVTMKHVGLNVASDPLFTASYTGIKSGLVVVTADDPGMYSSQNEQDNRNYAPFAKVPMLEPSDSEEARNFVHHALNISEEFDTPALLRMTTRLSHSKTLVHPSSAHVAVSKPGFERAIKKYVMVPAYGSERHKLVEQRTLALKDYVETFQENFIVRAVQGNDAEIGIITSGIVFQHVMEVFEKKADILKLGMTFPLPECTIRAFVETHPVCFVIEELDPYLDGSIRAMGISLTGDPALPRCGELNPDSLRMEYGELINDSNNSESSSVTVTEDETTLKLPPRPPVMCPGCPHRGVFHVLSKLKLNVMGDIGCYTLGALPPLEAMDSCVCMGASIGLQIGLEAAVGEGTTVAVIGDSTFLHSGVTPLIDLVYTQGHGTVIILDNRTTAMTGGQPHPGSGTTLRGDPAPRVDFKTLCEAVGIRDIKVIDPLNLEETKGAITAAIAHPGPSVIITNKPCVLTPDAKKDYWNVKYTVDGEKCVDCEICSQLGCPALIFDKETGAVTIVQEFCTGCGLCAQICPTEAIREKV